MGNALMIAAGGGGDAVTAAMIGPALKLTDAHPTVMTYSWDRLIVDPLPGPRSASDFCGLKELGPGVLEVLATTSAAAPAGSALPTLAARLPARLLLLDPIGGAAGLALQIEAAAAHFNSSEIIVVDVGGDAVSQSGDPGLRSPLADLLTLAACSRVSTPSRLIVAGPGLDGELSDELVLRRLQELSAVTLATLDESTAQSVRDIYEWHPSEASGLLLAAAYGLRGVVEVRDAGSQVRLTADSARVHAVDLRAACAAGPAKEVAQSQSLAEAQATVRKLTGISELDYETRKASTLSKRGSHLPHTGDLTRIDTYGAEAARRGADYVSVRRLAELLGVHSAEHLAEFRHCLAINRSDRYRPPIYRV